MALSSQQAQPGNDPDMEFSSDPMSDQSRLVAQLDPYLFLLQADLAVEKGHRARAVELIARVYLAFDLLAAGDDEISERGSIPRERSN
jgi:hypothetical protein